MTLEASAQTVRAARSVDRVWDGLDSGGFQPEKRGDSFMALCPVHGDTHRSMSVRYDRRNELTMLHCFTCNAPAGDIAGSIGLTMQDLFDKPLPDRPKGEWKKTPRKPSFRPTRKLPARITRPVVDADELKGATWSEVMVYPYANEQGVVVEEVVREQAVVDGITHKRFTQRFLGASGRMIRRKPEGFTAVLYQQAGVVAAIAAGTPVWVVEGEKDADNAIAAGVVATTNAQGAGSFPDNLAEIFAGATVNVVADQDLAGWKRAVSLHQTLTFKGATVRLFLPATSEAKSDLSDHLAAGYRIEDLTPITSADAVALVALGEARKILEGIEISELEVTAHMHLVDGESSRLHVDATHAWVEDTENRVRKMVQLASEGRDGTQLSETGTTAAAQLSSLLAQAAVQAARVHELAGIPTPRSIADQMPRTVVQLPVGGSGGGGSGSGGYWGEDYEGDDTENTGVTYGLHRGETVQVKTETDRNGITHKKYIRIMRGWVEVKRIDVADDGIEAASTPASHSMQVDFVRWQRGDDGTVLRDENDLPVTERQEVTWEIDDIQNGTWVNSIPWPGFLEQTSRRGKDQAWDAIFSARRPPAQRTSVYTTTGWRESETGPFFVHAGGAITKAGSLPLETQLPGPYQAFALPEPTTDRQLLRQAWKDGAVPIMTELPARIVAPLFGVVWRSVFHRVPMITHLVGGKAAYKTTTARLAVQFFAPALHGGDGGQKEVVSGSNQGSSGIGLTRVLGLASDVPILVDDFAPDGDAKKAQTKLSELARTVYNGTTRFTGDRRGGVNSARPINSSLITSGELGITGSGDTRVLNIPLDPGAIRKGVDTFVELERKSARNARGLLGASFIRWIAENRAALLAEHEEAQQDFTSEHSTFLHWRKRLSHLAVDEGLRGRLIESAMFSSHGVHLMLRMMVDQGALTRDEANAYHRWAEEGIYEAVTLQDTSSGDAAEQLLGFLREALTSGGCHLTTAETPIPDDADALGWSQRGSGDYATWAPNGARLGIIKGEGENARVYLFPSVAIGMARQIAARADETFSETAISIGASLHSHGWLVADKAGQRTVGRRVGGTLMRVWDIPLSVITGDNNDPHDDTGDNTPDTPSGPPSLFDNDPAPAQPPAAPAEPITDPAPQPPATGTSPAAAAVPRRPAAAGKKAPTNTFRAAAAVLHTDGLWLPDGTNVPLPRPITHLGDIATIIAELHLGVQNSWKSEDGQILATYDAALSLGIPLDQINSNFDSDRTEQLQELTTNHPLITKAIEAGFTIGGKKPALNATTRIWNDQNRDLRGRFVLIPALKSDFDHLLKDDPSPATIARRLQKFADALHAPYAISASSVGLDLMQHLAPTKEKRESWFAPSSPVPPAEITTLEADIDWQRKPTQTETAQTYIHAYDRGGSYLAACSGLELGYDTPTYHPDGAAFDKRIPGYWRIVMPTRGEYLWPNPIDPRNRTDEFAGQLTWVTTQTLDIAEEMGYEPEVREAYLWTNHTRLYDKWYERMRDARSSLDTDDVDDQQARDLLKEVYVRALGLTASFDHHKGRPGFAPERYHLIQARAKANILRRINQIGQDTGRWPVAVWRDTILYTSDEADPTKAWPGKPEHLGRGLGQFKCEGSATMIDHRQFLTGVGRYEGKSELYF